MLLPELLIVTSSGTDKKLEIDRKLENKLEIYKNLEIKLEIYSYLNLEIFESFLSMVHELNIGLKIPSL